MSCQDSCLEIFMNFWLKGRHALQRSHGEQKRPEGKWEGICAQVHKLGTVRAASALDTLYIGQMKSNIDKESCSMNIYISGDNKHWPLTNKQLTYIHKGYENKAQDSYTPIYHQQQRKGEARLRDQINRNKENGDGNYRLINQDDNQWVRQFHSLFIALLSSASPHHFVPLNWIYCLASVTTPSYSLDRIYSNVRSKWRFGPSRLGFGPSSLVCRLLWMSSMSPLIYLVVTVSFCWSK